MKTALTSAIIFSFIASASVSIAASPKCSHRTASSSNDLLRNTNPEQIKATTKLNKETLRRGRR